MLSTRARHLLVGVVWRFPFIRALSSYRPVILMYHGIPSRTNSTGLNARIFEQHIVFLQRHFEIVPPGYIQDKRKPLNKLQVILTFDDGFRNQAEVVAPILRKYHVPALFFVSSRHSIPGKYLWFSYLAALEKHFQGNRLYLGGELIDMSADKRHNNMLRLRQTLLGLKPHPAAMYDLIDNELPRLEDFVPRDELADHFAGMTSEQVGELATDPLFFVGIHTVDHPFLTKCSPEEVRRQILNNKIWLEQISSKYCSSIAYPAGWYNSEVLHQIRSLRIKAGYALTPILNSDPEYEVQRIGVYSPSLAILVLKLQLGNVIEQVRFQCTGRL